MPRWAPDGSEIAYVSVDPNPRARGHAMLVLADGSHARPVFPSLNPYMVTWSPDGHRLAVDVHLDGNNNGLYIGDLMSGGAKRIYGHDGFGPESPDWAPDGATVLFSDGSDLFTIRPDGSGLHQLTGRTDGVLVDEAGQHFSGSWSRDGREIVFDYSGNAEGSKFQIGIMRSDGMGAHLLTDGRTDSSRPDY
jgi:Tol biopolymer transport system component